MKQRSNAFDLLCGICIVRMIMLHITQFTGLTNLDWWQETMHWTYFFMSFFFFKAGYFNKTIDGPSRPFLLDKTRRLLVPYFAWGVIGCVVYFSYVLFVFPAENTNAKRVCLEHLWETSSWYGNDPIWFLFSFYMMYVVAHFMSRIPSLSIGGKRYGWLWLSVVFPCISYELYTHQNPLYLNLNNVFYGVFLFWLGRSWHRLTDALPKDAVVALSTLLLVVFIILNVQFDISHNMLHNAWRGNFWALWVATTCVMCGLSGLLTAFRLPRIPVVGFIGEHSMVYFVSHMIVIMFYHFTRSAYAHTLRGNWDDYYILIGFTFVICTLLVPHVERIPLLSGRYEKRKYKLWII